MKKGVEEVEDQIKDKHTKTTTTVNRGQEKMIL